MLKFVLKRDELDQSVYSVLENMIENPPTKENTDFVYNNITKIAMSLPPVKSLPVPTLFIRALLGFRVLRRIVRNYIKQFLQISILCFLHLLNLSLIFKIH